MRPGISIWIAALAAMFLFAGGAACSHAQPGNSTANDENEDGDSDQEQSAEELRAELARLEATLAATDSKAQATPAPRRGVTEIGETKVAPKSTELEFEVRIYDLEDLLNSPPDYPALAPTDLDVAEQMLFPQAGAVSRPRLKIEDLIATIKTSVYPESWQDFKKSMSIAPLGLTLVISADAATHAQIESLISQIRKHSGPRRTVTVRAQWLWLTNKELSSLLADKQPGKAGEAPSQAGIVNSEAWQALLERTSSAEESDRPAGYAAAVSGADGQTVHVISGDQSRAITSVALLSAGSKETKGDSTPVAAFEPKIGSRRTGAVLQCTPVTSANQTFLTLDLHSRVALRVDEEESRPLSTDAYSIASASIDHARYLTQNLSTTIRVPFQQTMLVGGMTFREESDATYPTLYLFVTAAMSDLGDESRPSSGAALSSNDRRGE